MILWLSYTYGPEAAGSSQHCAAVAARNGRDHTRRTSRVGDAYRDYVCSGDECEWDSAIGGVRWKVPVGSYDGDQDSVDIHICNIIGDNVQENLRVLRHGDGGDKNRLWSACSSVICTGC